MTSTQRWWLPPEHTSRPDTSDVRAPMQAAGTTSAAATPLEEPSAEDIERMIAETRISLERVRDRLDDRPSERESVARTIATLDRIETAVETAVRSGHAPAGEGFELPPQGIPLETVERSLVEQALERSGGNRTRAGELLGLTRDQVRYRIEKFGLDGGDHR